MVEGVFKKNTVTGLFLIVFGILVILLPFFFMMEEGKDNTGTFAIASAGALMCIIGVSGMLLNYKAFLRVEESRIRGKYAWFSKIGCDFSEVAFVAPQPNGMVVLLKNGKRHNIIGLSNSYEVCAAILKKIHFEINDEPQKLVEKLKRSQKKQKNELFLVCGTIVLSIVIVIITAALTGWKDLSDFNQTDWLIFAIMCVLETAVMVAEFYFALKAGKGSIHVDHLAYITKKSAVESTPLPPGNAKTVYSDLYYEGRLIVCGYPNDSSIYFTVQILTPDYSLETIHTSEIFDDEEKMPIKAEDMIDITERVLPKS